jgi:hypothetical protein
MKRCNFRVPRLGREASAMSELEIAIGSALISWSLLTQKMTNQRGGLLALSSTWRVQV